MLARKPNGAWRDRQTERLAIFGPLAKELAALIELLDTSIFPIRNVNHVVLIDRNRMRQPELARPITRSSPLTHLFSILRVFQDPSVGIAIRNEDIAVFSKRDVGSTAEVVIAWSRLAANLDLQQLLACW